VTPDEMTPAQLCESLRTNYCVGDAVERCGICGPCVAAEMIERLSGAAEPSAELVGWRRVVHLPQNLNPSHEIVTGATRPDGVGWEPMYAHPLPAFGDSVVNRTAEP
jgi:hypothetical protein